MDRIIANGFVVTCNAGQTGGRLNILIREGRIASITADLQALTVENPNASVVDASRKLIIPGFVNAHTHGESSLHQAFTSGRHFRVWRDDPLLGEASRMFRNEPQEVECVYRASYADHLRFGTTTVGEFGPPVGADCFSQIVESTQAFGTRSLLTLQNWEQISRARELGLSRGHCLIGLGAAEDLTVYTFSNLAGAAKAENLPLLAHIAETREEADVLMQNFSKPPIALLAEFGILQKGTVVVHANYISEEDITILRDKQIPVVITPRSTALKHTGYPSLRGLISSGVHLCLGTDWGKFDLLAEMQFMYLLPLLLPGFKELKACDILSMATLHGAQALGLDEEVGSTEPGKRADLTFF